MRARASGQAEPIERERGPAKEEEEEEKNISFILVASFPVEATRHSIDRTECHQPLCSKPKRVDSAGPYCFRSEQVVATETCSSFLYFAYIIPIAPSAAAAATQCSGQWNKISAALLDFSCPPTSLL